MGNYRVIHAPAYNSTLNATAETAAALSCITLGAITSYKHQL